MLQLGDERAVGADLSRDFAAVGDLRVLTPCNAAAEDNARNPRDHDPKQEPLKRSHRVHLSRAPGSRFTMVTAFGFQSIAEAVIRGLWWRTALLHSLGLIRLGKLSAKRYRVETRPFICTSGGRRR
jgi:hypothetical protein